MLVDKRDDLSETKEVTRLENVTLIKADLSQEAEIERMWTQVIGRYSRVDILINNAAQVHGKKFKEMEISEFRNTISVNLLAYVHLAKLFLMQKNDEDLHLVNVNSIAGHCACQANSDYCASKYGIHGFTDALRHELPVGTKMTNFYPYYIDTGLFKGFKPLLGFVIPMLTPEYVSRRMY